MRTASLPVDLSIHVLPRTPRRRAWHRAQGECHTHKGLRARQRTARHGSFCSLPSVVSAWAAPPCALRADGSDGRARDRGKAAGSRAMSQKQPDAGELSALLSSHLVQPWGTPGEADTSSVQARQTISLLASLLEVELHRTCSLRVTHMLFENTVCARGAQSWTARVGFGSFVWLLSVRQSLRSRLHSELKPVSDKAAETSRENFFLPF